MNLSNFSKLLSGIAKHFAKNGPVYTKCVGGAVLVSAVTIAACHVAYKKLEEKHRKEDAEKYKQEFTKKLKELEKRYQHNEFLLKRKINELCEEFGIPHVC